MTARDTLFDAAPAIGLIMLAVVLFLALVAIVANEAFKRNGLPDDEGDE